MKLTSRPITLAASVQTILLASTLSVWSVPALAQAPAERLTDRDVQLLIENVDVGRDKFEGNLDGDFKGSTLRTGTVETKVAGALQDYQDSVKKLKDRFTSSYSASAEVTTVLKQSNSIDTFMKGQPLSMKGRSEWDRQSANLKQLAEAYGTTFPMPDGAPVRRMNDKEVSAAAAEVASAANRFKDDLGKVTTLPKPDRDAARKDVDLLVDYANNVKDRTGDSKPSTAEFRQLLQQVAKVQTFIGAHQLPTVMTNWQAVQSSLAKLQQGFAG